MKEDYSKPHRVYPEFDNAQYVDSDICIMFSMWMARSAYKVQDVGSQILTMFRK